MQSLKLEARKTHHSQLKKYNVLTQSSKGQLMNKEKHLLIGKKHETLYNTIEQLLYNYAKTL